MLAALQAHDFARAHAAARDLGKNTEYEDAGELTLTRNELLTLVDDELKQARAQAVAAFEAHAGPADAGLAPIDRLLGQLRDVARLEPADDFPVLAEAITDLERRRSAALESGHKQRAEQEHEDLKKAALFLSGTSVRTLLLDLQLDELAQSAGALEGELHTDLYRGRVASFRGEVEALARLIAALRSTVEAGTLKDNTIKDLGSGDEAKIVALVNHTDLRAEYSRGVGSVATTIRLVQYANGPGLVELLLDRWEQNADELAARARGAMLLAAARAGEKLAPLADAAQAYDPGTGWAAVRARISGLNLSELNAPDLGAVLKRLAKIDPARATELEAWLEPERAAFAETAHALCPFLGVEGPSFGQAAQLLRDLVAKRAGSHLVAVCYPLLDGGQFQLPLVPRK
ncbi:MAG: hypothetical protein U1E76_08195 [Planctomycetota bacterium]